MKRRFVLSQRSAARIARVLGRAAPGAVVVGLGDCLGPNPGFFIGTSVANATISTLVNAFLSSLLGLGA